MADNSNTPRAGLADRARRVIGQKGVCSRAVASGVERKLTDALDHFANTQEDVEGTRRRMGVEDKGCHVDINRHRWFRLRDRWSRGVQRSYDGAKVASDLIQCATLALCAIAVWVGFCFSIYWSLIDTVHPLDFIKGEAVLDKVNHQVQPVWHVKRNRHCPGIRYAWLKDGMLQNVPDLKIPGNPEEIGQDIVGHEFILKGAWIDVDPRITDNFNIVTEMDYKCNLWQKRVVPLAVYPPAICVQQGDTPCQK